ncbi:MAG: alpha/beta hydrolase [Bacteroidota bacterium]
MKAKTLTLICLLIISAAFSPLCAQPAGSEKSLSPGQGDSVNIFLLMGLTRESGHWSQLFITELKKNAPQARIFFLDLPGSGKHVNAKSCLTIKGMIDFMRPEALEIMKANKGGNIICATSLGGMVATEWTIQYKDDFQGLIMINSSFKGICTQKERARPEVRMTMLKILLSGSVEKREKLIISINSNKPEIYDSIANINIDIQNKRKMSRMNIFRQTFAGMRYQPEGKPGLPLLIIGSKADSLVCPECIEKTYEAFGGTLVWSQTSGHGLPIDEPVWLSEQIAHWVNTLFEQKTFAQK